MSVALQAQRSLWKRRFVIVGETHMKMSHKVAVLSVVGVTLLLMAMVEFIGTQSFHYSSHLKKLDLSQVRSISVYSLSAEERAELSKDEISNLVDQLHDVVLIGEGTSSFVEYDGGLLRMFSIELEDGTSFDFSASNPFYIVNAEKGFESDYDICDALSNTYYSLVAKYFD